jgi:hypothetical protein
VRVLIVGVGNEGRTSYMRGEVAFLVDQSL